MQFSIDDRLSLVQEGQTNYLEIAQVCRHLHNCAIIHPRLYPHPLQSPLLWAPIYRLNQVNIQRDTRDPIIE